MPDYALVFVGEEGESRRLPISADGTLVGRSPEANVVLSGPHVSRLHARLWVEEGVLMVEDLQSRNGIGIDGKRVKKGRLEIGDELTIGDYRFVVAKAKEQRPRSKIITYDRASTLYDRIVKQEGSGRLPTLYKAAQLLGSVFDLDELFEQILQVIFESVRARRGFILTLSPDTNEPVVRASLAKEEGLGGLPLSRTLLRRVFDEKNAILTQDAQQDERFSATDSIIGYAIHSAMCAPLCGRQSIVGAIYVDSGAETGPFQNEDLELLTALGRVVGVAVENARLYQESVARERLAAVGQATAGVGHCMKNILAGVLGGAEFIDKAVQERNWQWVIKGWRIVRRAIGRVDMLVMNLLTFSRDHKPDRAGTDLNAVVEEVVENVRLQVRDGKPKLEVKKGDLEIAHVDGRAIYRVILNLVTNAVEACQETGSLVIVSTARHDEEWLIEVRDDGCGIEPEAMSRLSEAFYSTKGSSGIGLGLACSYKIVQEHGGKIAVDSTPGQGATFTVHLPIVDASKSKLR